MSTKKRRTESTKKACNTRTHGGELRRALNWVLKDGIFDNLTVHGNAGWTAVGLVRIAVFWVWHADNSLVAAANGAIAIVRNIFGRAEIKSYQSLTDALVKYSCQLLPRLWQRLHTLMERCDQGSWRVGMWLALAVDGSRVGVPRTWKNEQRFCKPRGKKKREQKRKNKRSRHAHQARSKYRKKKHYDPQPVGPQMWLTLIWHLGQRMPWCWEIGPSYSSERAHLLQILNQQTFPENTLFCCDAGFVGYDFWKAIQDRGHHFLIRVGGNVRLLKQLGYARERNGIVYCWPNEAMRRKQPPLVLRLLKFQDARGEVYLVTNVLNQKDLTHRDASEIYRQRWGVEVQFRSFKQTFGRSKLRSRTPERAEIELHWSLIGLWIIQLLAYKEQRKLTEPPKHTSVAAALRIIREIMNNPAKVPPKRESLAAQLANATTDDYKRNSKKQSRNYPRRKEEPATGKPKLQTATAKHKRNLQELQTLWSEAV